MSTTASSYIYINFLASLLNLLTRIPISNNGAGDFILALLVSAFPGFVWYQSGFYYKDIDFSISNKIRKYARLKKIIANGQLV